MRLSTNIHSRLIAQNPTPHRHPLDPAEPWLNTLIFGAILAALALSLSAAWRLADWGARTNGFPPRRILSGFYGYTTISIAACQWMAAWALTMRAPRSLDRLGVQRMFCDRGHAASLLRLLASISFLILSLQLFGLIGDGLNPRFGGTRSRFLMELIELTISLLLWSQLRQIGRFLGHPILAKRCLIIMVGMAATSGCFSLGPRFAALIHQPLPLPRLFFSAGVTGEAFWQMVGAALLFQFARAFLSDLSRIGS